MIMDDDCLRIGIITQPHGIKGEVKVYPTTDDLNRFNTIGTCIAANEHIQREMKIESVKYFKNMVILKLDAVNSMNDAETWRNAELWIHRSQSPLEEGQYFLCDLIDLDVYNENDMKIGTVTDVLETGANDVYQITKTDGKELLLPAIPDCILNIDLENHRMTVYVLPGLED